MIGKIQRTGIPQLLAAVIFSIGLSMPALASENQAGSLRVSAIVDHAVFNPQGQELGNLEDFVIKRNGSVKIALITSGRYDNHGR